MATTNGHNPGVVEESVVGFERNRIKVLQEERQYIQKKTFTKWVNSHLSKSGQKEMVVNDLFTDLADGKMLLRLLEIISGEKIGKPSNGKMRIQKVENLNKSLAFLHTKVRLESIGAEDIVDGNPTLILGLIWTIILRFQIQDIQEYADESSQTGEKKSAKEALLLWAQRKTHGYQGVKVENFTSSWKNGMGFNALIHAHRPDLIEYDRLRPDRPLENLNYAFDIAEKHLGIARLIDAEDILERPDEKSVITYVSSYYHTFAKMRTEQTGSKRIAKIVGSLIEIDRLKQAYERLSSELLAWLLRKMKELSDRKFPNTSDGLHQEFLKFKEYRLKEKPPRMMERGNIEVAFFEIQTKLKALGQKVYLPPEGYSIHEVDQRWKELESAEHQRETALRDAMIRLEKLERLAEKFERKANLRETWLTEMTAILNDQKVGNSLAKIDAALKKFEAIKADIQPREDRFRELSNMATELINEDYHGKEKIRRRCDEVIRKWRSLLELLEKRRRVLDMLGDLLQMVRDADSIYNDLKAMEAPLRSADTGQHLASVHAMQEKHALVEAELSKIGKILIDLNNKAPRLITPGNDEGALLQNSLARVNEQYKAIVQLAQARRTKLDEALQYYQFEDDAEEEDLWAMEKLRLLEAMPVPKDSRQVLGSQQKAKSLDSELNGRWGKVQMMKASGEGLISRGHPSKSNIQKRLQSLQEHWTALRNLLQDFIHAMNAAAEFFQYHADANEVESWLKEARMILSGMNPSGDGQDVEPLMKRHARLEEEIGTYEPDVKRLNDQANKLQKVGGVIAKLRDTPRLMSPEREEIGQGEPSVEESVESQTIPQVVAMFPFKLPGQQKQEFSVKKGEVLTLMAKASDEWWHVIKADGTVGTAPANHLKEIEPKVVRTTVKRSTSTLTRQNSKLGTTRDIPTHLDPRALASRQEDINNAFGQLKNDAADRRRLLGEASGFRDFLRECGELELWITEQFQSVFAENNDEPVANQQKRYDNFLPEYNTRKKHLAELQKISNDLIGKKHHSAKEVRQTMEDLLGHWRDMEAAKAAKEKDLEYRGGMDAFDDAVKNASDYINEKCMVLRVDSPTNGDISTMKRQQKRIANFERELVPIHQMIDSVKQKGVPLRKQYPQDAKHIADQERELEDQARDLQEYLKNKRNDMESDMSQTVFLSALADLMEWVEQVREPLQDDPVVEDHKMASALRRVHHNLMDDVRAHEPEFEEVAQLGAKIVQTNPEVKEALTDLQATKQDLEVDVVEKDNALGYVEDLMDLNRRLNRALDDVGRLETVLSDAPDVGSTNAEVETLLKRHEDFDRSLDATEQRSLALLREGAQLLKERPNRRELIDVPREKVQNNLAKLQEGLRKYPELREMSKRRKLMLMDSLGYQTWKGDVEDLNQWMESLLPVMEADPTEEDIGSEKAYRRHAKQVAEIQANADRVKQLSDDGKDMIIRDHFAAPKVGVLLEQMLTKWDDVTNKADARNRKFEQAAKARGFFGNVDKAKSRLVQIQLLLQRGDENDENADPRKLRTELKNAESSIKHAESMVELVKNDADFLAQNGHFNGPKLLQTANQLEHQLEELRDPAKKRWAELEEIVHCNAVVSEMEKEVHWIDERMKLVMNPNEGKTLDETASLLAKLETIEQEVVAHEPVAKKVVADGTELTKRYPQNQWYARLRNDVIEKWQKLRDLLPVRRQKLEIVEKGHNYRLDHADVSDWVEHNLHLVRTNPGLGKDAESTKKMLETNNQVAREFQVIKGVVDDLDKRAKTLIQGGHPDAQGIAASHKQLRQKADELEELLNQRNRYLNSTEALHDFLDQCNEFDTWLADQMRVAENTDVGPNSETLNLTAQEFENFDKRVAEFGPRRMKMIKQEADALKKRGPPIATEVEGRVQALEQGWTDLNEAIARREDILDKMKDIFRFDEQVNEAMERIQETLSLCYGDDPKDLQEVVIRQKRHDEAEKEMKAIGQLIGPLKEDSIKLIEDYPGKDAEHVSKQRELLQENWDALRNAVGKRKNELAHFGVGHKWLVAAKDLMKWGEDTLDGMGMENVDKDKVSVDVLMQHHDDVRGDINSRQDDFDKLIADGDQIGKGNGPLVPIVKERTKNLEDLRVRLAKEWDVRRKSLDELSLVKKFLRDLDLLDAASVAQETYLNTKEPSDLTVDQIRKLITKHAAFEKVVAQQADKLKGLEDHANVLLHEHRIDPRLIIPRLKEVTERRKRIGELTKQKTLHLNDALVYAEFVDIASDMESWIDEKVNHMRTNPIDELSFEEKIRKLIKHQTFEAELNANAARIDYVKKSAGDLLRNKHEKSSEVDATMQKLLHNWANLLRLAGARSKALDDAKDMVEFQNECDRTEKWMREKEQMLLAEDLGKDLEHCLFLQRKLDDVGSDMKFDEDQIKKINTLADKLSRSGVGNMEAVGERRRSLNANWENLHKHLDQYRGKLKIAKDLHGLANAVDDITELLLEKSNGLNLEDADDLDEATAMIRKHESLLRDFDACVQRMDSLEKEILTAHKLHPTIVKHFKLDEKMMRLRHTWDQVSSRIAAKKSHLDRMHALLRFLKEVQDFCDWSEEVQSQINSASLAQDSAEAERLKEQHDDVKATIQGREEKYSHLFNTARGLVKDSRDSHDPAVDAEKRLRDTWNKLNGAWDLRSLMLRQCHEQQVFNELVDQVESWLTSKEAFLSSEEPGSSMSEVESLLRKHNAFENTVQRQSDKVTDLDKFSQKLITDNHYAKEDIADRYEAVQERLDHIQKRSKLRKAQLEQSERFQQFSKSLAEFNAWMEEKFAMANDNSWKDPVHLEHKLQKQASFETELNANQGRMEALVNEGKNMIKDGHFNSDSIDQKIGTLEEDWKLLLEASADKKRLLNEVQYAVNLTRRIEEFESWLEHVEAILQSDDIGTNVSTCLKLMEKADATKLQIAAEAPVLKELNDKADQLPQNEHFLTTEIANRLESANKRYSKLDDLVKSRLNELGEAQKLHHFNLEYHEIILWYKEKQTQLSSRELGSSYSDAQNHLRRVVQVEDEINEYSGNLQKTLETGCELVASDAFASEPVTAKLDELRDSYKNLQKQCQDKKHLCQESVESQKFYAEAQEMEAVYAQKKILLEVKDVGDDEDSSKLLIKKLDAAERDVHAFGKNVERLGDQVEVMRGAGHFDVVNVNRRLEGVKDHHRELNGLVKSRRAELLDGQKLFAFYEDCASLMVNIREKMVVADSEDYGTDVEHVDILLAKFGNFQKGLSILQIRVKNINDKGLTLVNEGHPQVQAIKTKITEISEVWRRLQESTKSRQAALIGAKEVHIFVRDCDETISWIQERDAAVSSEDFGQDLEAVQSLIRRHEGFQRDLAPFGQRVAQLNQEAANLITRYPDARIHIERKQHEMQNSWMDLKEKATLRKEHLHLAELVQSYLNKYREFSLWISEMLAVITSYELPQDVRRAEALLRRHKEHKAEIDSRQDDYQQIKKEGLGIISKGHFMAEEIREKLKRLETGYESLNGVWKTRNELYALNLDVQIFYRDCNMLTTWMRTQEPVLHDDNMGESIHGVEELLRKHDDFTKTVENQEDRLNLVRRLTELEKARQAQLAREREANDEDRQRHEIDRRAAAARLESKSAETEAVRKTSVGRASSFTPSTLKKKMLESPQRTESFVQKDGNKQGFSLGRSVFQKSKPDGQALAPVDMEGMLDRKQELESGGHKSSSRSWKTFHTVLCGQLLCFFKKRQQSYDRNAAAPPLNLYECIISQAYDYKKKDFVFRLHLRDGSEYLFAADDEAKMREWIEKIQFHAALPPNMQLLSLESARQAGLEAGDDSAERAIQFARTLSRNTPSPLSNGSDHAVPVPKPRVRISSPESDGVRGNGTEPLNGVPEVVSEGKSESTVPKQRVGRSESFGGDTDNGFQEREVDVVDSRDRAKTSSSILEPSSSGKGSRGVTLPVGASLHAVGDEKKGASAEKRGSRVSLVAGLFKRKHDK